MTLGYKRYWIVIDFRSSWCWKLSKSSAVHSGRIVKMSRSIKFSDCLKNKQLGMEKIYLVVNIKNFAICRDQSQFFAPRIVLCFDLFLFPKEKLFHINLSFSQVTKVEKMNQGNVFGSRGLIFEVKAIGQDQKMIRVWLRNLSGIPFLSGDSFSFALLVLRLRKLSARGQFSSK